MCEIMFRHEIVCLNNPVNIRTMDPNGNSHDHVLWSFRYASINVKKVGTFESLKLETRRWLA